uniref:Cytochrome c oxidase subunit 2 n=1 Tax=Graptacme eborea TaxID=55752 RepID=Q68SQ4_GRAEB|nr:cytochrome c oxidase subunit II [Graptacme eborea]AAT98394.1 cytochrome c oxidase subunit II [Graptacme eborea]
MFWSQLSFQDGSSNLMEQLIFFHDYTMLVVVMIMTMVIYSFISFMINSFSGRFILEGQMIETIWTIIPAMILIFLAFPSLSLLYLLDEVNNPMVTLKVMGHQWYWSYEYSDYNHIEYDSYMLPEEDLYTGEFRLLEVDNRVIMPMMTDSRILVSSSDVIHSWAIPSMGLKVDAVPGRLNQLGLTIKRPGVFYGQCSEICGANHSFMPIVLESVSTKSFLKWLD